MSKTLRSFALLVLLAGLATSGAPLPAGASELPFHVPPRTTHTIQSKHVDQTFRIHVQQPVSRKDGSERFPVLYLTDSTGGLAFSATVGILQLGADVERFITVGIGYPAEHGLGGMTLRTRDLTPTESQQSSAGAPALPIEGVLPIESGKRSGGAAEFLAFIRDELQPLIDSEYPTVPGERAYWGDSLGGLFGLYVMFNAPDTFNRYIIGSPSVWWDDEVILDQAKKFAGSGKPLRARVFMSVGALEEVGGESAGFRMVTNVFRIEQALRAGEIPGLELQTLVIPDETHTSVIASNFVRGLKSVFDKPDVSFLQAYMMEQAADAAERTRSE